MTVYGRFAGGRLAIVGSMPHAAFREGVHAAREFGCEIWLLVQAGDRHTGGRPLPRADRVLHVDTHDWRAIVDAVTDSEGRPAVHGVTSFRVDLTEATARAAEHLGLPSQGLEAVRTANRRHLLRRALGDDPANVKWRLVSSAEELDEAIRYVGLPLVVRPPSGAAPHGARTCGTGAEAVAAWRSCPASGGPCPGGRTPGPSWSRSGYGAPGSASNPSPSPVRRTSPEPPRSTVAGAPRRRRRSPSPSASGPDCGRKSSGAWTAR